VDGTLTNAKLGSVDVSGFKLVLILPGKQPLNEEFLMLNALSFNCLIDIEPKPLFFC